MRSLKTKGRGLSTAILLLALCAMPAWGGVIRDDRPDILYRLLGCLYPNVGLVTAVDASVNPDFRWNRGTAVLIDREWILTAAHLGSGGGLGAGFGFDDPEITFGCRTYAIDQWVPFPLYDPALPPGPRQWQGYDIALAHLETKVRGVGPARLYRDDDEVGKLGIAVGYGLTGNGADGGIPFGENDWLKRAGTNRVDVIDAETDYIPAESGRILGMDFDNPHDPADSVFGSPRPTCLEIMPGPGDSGGGLFVDGKLAGITAFAIHDGFPFYDYGETSWFTRVSPFADWVDDIIDGGDGSGFVEAMAAFAGDVPTVSFEELGLTNMSISSLPEPTTIVLLGLGALAALRRRRGQCPPARRPR